MKKTISLFALVALMMSMMSVTAFAHGHGRSYRTVQQPPRYAVCTIDGCALYGVHAHNGTYYNCAPHSAAHPHAYRGHH